MMMGAASGSSPFALNRVGEAMKKRITLTIDEELIKRAKFYSKKRGKTLSQTVADYFAVMGHPTEINEEDLSPEVRSLMGILEGYDEMGYDGALEKRYL